MHRTISSLTLALPIAAPLCAQEQAGRPLWNGTDFTGWHGQRHVSPYELAAMPAAAREAQRAEDDASIRAHWRIENGELVNDGEGAFLTTDADHGDAEFTLEYRTVAKADSGIYLRGCPQVQIWDCTEAGGKWNLGADKGSGGLWNNEKHGRFPRQCADKPFGEWNQVAITIVGARVWVTLNHVLVTDGVVMENYWDRTRPLPGTGPLQLQTHGGEIRFRNLTVRAIDGEEANRRLLAHDDAGFVEVFDGTTFDGWRGDRGSYEIANGEIRCRKGSGGVLFTEATYADFAVRLAFRLPPAGNNGLAIRYPGEGDPAYTGLEVQVLDDSAPSYASAKPWQYHGSVYGVVAAQRGYLRPVGEWNVEQVTVRGSRIEVELNGTPIVDADIAGMPSHLGERHVGKDRKDGAFGFCGHDDPVAFRAIRVRRL